MWWTMVCHQLPIWMMTTELVLTNAKMMTIDHQHRLMNRSRYRLPTRRLRPNHRNHRRRLVVSQHQRYRSNWSHPIRLKMHRSVRRISWWWLQFWAKWLLATGSAGYWSVSVLRCHIACSSQCSFDPAMWSDVFLRRGYYQFSINCIHMELYHIYYSVYIEYYFCLLLVIWARRNFWQRDRDMERIYVCFWFLFFCLDLIDSVSIPDITRVKVERKIDNMHHVDSVCVHVFGWVDISNNTKCTNWPVLLILKRNNKKISENSLILLQGFSRLSSSLSLSSLCCFIINLSDNIYNGHKFLRNIGFSLNITNLNSRSFSCLCRPIYSVDDTKDLYAFWFFFFLSLFVLLVLSNQFVIGQTNQ